jgi:tRNA modification GTPase
MTALFDTIAAEATPAGRGALRVVRLSGPRAVWILKELFAAAGPLPWERPRSLCLGFIGSKGHEPLDHALAVCFRAPDSLTGEDVVEIQAHGAPGIVRGILDLALGLGARMALPGEFSYRAYLNDKMSVLEAEAINALVDAQTDGQARRLGRGLRGGVESELRNHLDRVMDIRAQWEAAIDFPEDVEEQVAAASRETLGKMERRLSSLMMTAPALRFLREGWRVALVGPANSGKSSLFNALLRRERALVSPHPGTTRDVLEESVQIGGYPLILMDTAGVRDALDPVEALGMERGLHMAGRADGVLLVVDGSRGWEDEAEAILEELKRPPLAIVANKSDLAPSSLPRGARALAVSALTGEGIDALSAVLQSWMESTLPIELDQINSARQAAAVGEALAGCQQALRVLDDGGSEDLATPGLIRVQEALDALLGGGAPEDLYDRVFARFCIGK